MSVQQDVIHMLREFADDLESERYTAGEISLGPVDFDDPDPLRHLKFSIELKRIDRVLEAV